MDRLLCFIFCLLSVAAGAQTSSTPVSSTLDAYWSLTPTPVATQAVLSLSEVVLSAPATNANVIALQQEGVGNRANLQILAGSANQLEVMQSNNGNVANALLAGMNNGITLYQAGASNQVNIELSGSNNQFLLTQDGGDVVNMQGLNQSGTRLELIQGIGNNSFSIDNSTLVKDPFSTGIPNLRIEQTGGAAVTIQSGRIIGN